MRKHTKRIINGLSGFPEICRHFSENVVNKSLSCGLHNSHPLLRWAWLPKKLRERTLGGLEIALSELRLAGFAKVDDVMAKLVGNETLFYSHLAEVFMAAYFLREEMLDALTPPLPHEPKKENDLAIRLGRTTAFVELYTPSDAAIAWEWTQRIRTAARVCAEDADAAPLRSSHKLVARAPASAPFDISDRASFAAMTNQAATELRRWFNADDSGGPTEQLYDSGDGFTVIAVPRDSSGYAFPGGVSVDLDKLLDGFFRKAANGQLTSSNLCVAACDLARTSEKDQLVLVPAAPEYDSLTNNLPRMPREVDLLLLSLFDLAGQHWGKLRWIPYTTEGKSALNELGAIDRSGV